MTYSQSHPSKFNLKVILVGNSGVGKTCLISSFFRRTFDSQSIPTVSPTYVSIDVTNSMKKQVCLQIWDTAGQERFHTVSQLFFRGSNVAMICYDMRDEESTNSVSYWAEKVKNESPECHIFIVVTKSDLIPNKDHSSIIKDAQSRFSSINPDNYFLTSAVNRRGVHELFIAASDLVDQNSIVPTDHVMTQSSGGCKC